MTVLKDILLYSKDGEWGKEEAFEQSELMCVIRGTDFEAVSVGDISGVPTRYIAQRHADRKRVEAWDIIIETAGGSKNRPTGRTLLIKPSMVASSEHPLICASFARFLRIDPERAFPPFVYWLLRHLYDNGVLFKYHTQHTGVARFQYTTFAENEPLDLPPLPTQQRIAAILSAYDDLIENNTRRIAILEEMARRLYEEWFIHFRFPGQEDAAFVEVGEALLPRGWEAQRVREIVTRRKNGTVYTQAQVSATGSTVVIDQSRAEVLGFHEYIADHDASPDRPIAIFGDHTCKMQVMVTPFSLGPNTVAFTGTAHVPLYYLFALIQGAVETKEYKRHWNDLMNKQVVVGADDLPQRYDEAVRPMFAMVEQLRVKSRNLRTQRDLLLPKLVSGQIDVTTAEAVLEAAE